MNTLFDTSITVRYKSRSQQTRAMSEQWFGANMFCPCCGCPSVIHYPNNAPVADFYCEDCREDFELKSSRKIGRIIPDGAYDVAIGRIMSAHNPHLCVLEYSAQYSVMNLTLVPKFFFVPAVFQRRTPLSDRAQRRGWVGSNILYNEIPPQGKISVISGGICRDKREIVASYKQSLKLNVGNVDKRGWLLDILHCVNKIAGYEFSLSEVYNFAAVLAERHPQNNNILPKIRQQLQFLRDKGYIEFLGRGKYRKTSMLADGEITLF